MKVERILADPAYVLHSWPYRESSVILDVLSEHHGRVRLLARGVKRSKGGQVLRPFNELALSWSGRSELKSLTAHELMEHRWLQGDALFCGLYANEITLRALRRHKAEESLFEAYQGLVIGLAHASEGGVDLEVPLRRFELALLSNIGYGINLEVDSEGQTLMENAWYVFDPDSGFRHSESADQSFSGKALAGIRKQAFDDKEVRRAALRIARAALAPHIGPGPLMSRDLTRKPTS